MTCAAVRSWLVLVLAGTIGCGSELVWYGHTTDRARRLEVRQHASRQWLTIGDRTSPSYDAIAAREIARSLDGGRVAFAAMQRDRSGRERWQVVDDLSPGRSWEAVAALAFDALGTHLTYLALDAGRWRVVVDGRAGPGFAAIDSGSLDFGPDGRRLGYVAFDGACTRAVIDDHVGPCRRAIDALALAATPAGDVEVASLPGDPNARRVWIGGAAVLDVPHAGVDLFTDPRRTQWLIRSAGAPGGRARLLGPAGLLADADALGDVVFAPDGRRFAFTLRQGESWRAVVAPAPGSSSDAGAASASGGAYRAIEPPVFSADGAHVAYLARTARTSEIVVDGRVRVRVPTPTATALALSDDGARLSFVHRDARGPVLVVDRAAYRFDVIVEGSLRFDARGRHWALLAGELAQRRLFVVVDGRVRLPFDSAELFGGGLGEGAPIELLGRWVRAELERYLARSEDRGA